MKITLTIPEHIARELELRAARRGIRFSTVLTDTLQRGLAQPDDTPAFVPLPVKNMGPPLVDIADRDALYRAMEGI
jgi:hypothetical protein